MLYRLFYILGFLSKYIVSYEIDEYELVIPDSFSSSVEYQDDVVLPVIELSDTNQDFIEYEEVVDNEDSFNEIPTDVISFIGPVKAKGSVSMAATFGYDTPPHTSYPSGFSLSSSWIPPPINPQQFFAPSPLFTPIPFTFSHIPLLSMFLPEMENLAFLDIDKNLLKERFDSTIDSKEIILKITPLINEDIGSSGNPVELLSTEEAPAPVVFLDEDFPDYETVDQDVVDMEDLPFNDDLAVKETSASRAVFGGFVPAKGSIKIAARF